MFAGIFASIGGKLIGAVVALGILGGAYLWITTAAFNRGKVVGITETTEHMKRAIAAQRQAAIENAGKWAATKPDEIDAELKRRCVASCKDNNAACVKGCE